MSERSIYALGARFATAPALLQAAETIQRHGFQHWDAHSPYPLPGLGEMRPVKTSALSQIVFLGGLLGLLSALALAFLPTSLLYPLIVGGKPSDWQTIPAVFPILFELTILGAALAAFAGLLVLTGLPRWHHPVFDWENCRHFSDDAFLLVIEARDPQFAEPATADLLTALGGQDLTRLEQ